MGVHLDSSRFEVVAIRPPVPIRTLDDRGSRHTGTAPVRVTGSALQVLDDPAVHFQMIVIPDAESLDDAGNPTRASGFAFWLSGSPRECEWWAEHALELVRNTGSTLHGTLHLAVDSGTGAIDRLVFDGDSCHFAPAADDPQPEGRARGPRPTGSARPEQEPPRRYLPEPIEQTVHFTVCCAPEEAVVDAHAWAVHVKRHRGGGWSVTDGADVCYGGGTAHDRRADCAAQHRFDEDTARRLARQAAPTVVVLGRTPAEFLAELAARRGTGS
ncbi:MAG: hypothetical protein HOV68_13115 [Streptomycetaceae bacterium]|nr:hypothetical protein [Streptomycetaceae bacterium]